jgi:hypothetical protein
MTITSTEPPKVEIEDEIPLLGDSEKRPADSPINTLETMIGLNLGIEMGEYALDAIADAGDMVAGFFEGVAPEVIGSLEGGAIPASLTPEPAMTPAPAMALNAANMPNMSSLPGMTMNMNRF